MVQCDNVQVVLNKVPILKGMTMKSGSSGFIGIIGSNGCGKTTLLRLLYRSIKASGGQVELLGRRIEDFTRRESARHIAVLPQVSEPMEGFTVQDVVLSGRTPYNGTLTKGRQENNEALWMALEDVGVAPLWNKRMETLSGGEKQRVFLARALAQETDILLLDEPSNNLDPGQNLFILDTIKKKKKVVIAVLHDINIAARCCDYIYAMADGQVKYKGTPEEVITCEIMDDLYGVACDVIDTARGRRVIF